MNTQGTQNQQVNKPIINEKKSFKFKISKKSINLELIIKNDIDYNAFDTEYLNRGSWKVIDVNNKITLIEGAFNSYLGDIEKYDIKYNDNKYAFYFEDELFESVEKIYSKLQLKLEIQIDKYFENKNK